MYYIFVFISTTSTAEPNKYRSENIDVNFSSSGDVRLRKNPIPCALTDKINVDVVQVQPQLVEFLLYPQLRVS